jgi:hypothetical protein
MAKSKEEIETVATDVVNTEVVATPVVINTALAAPAVTFSQPVNSDIEIPRLNVIQKMSEIDGDVGSIVLDKTLQLVDPKSSIKVVVVSALKRFKEDIPFDSEAIPQMVNTQEEANQLALTSDYPVLEFADIVVLIPQPEGVADDLFPYLINDVNHQLGKITVQKDAYRLTFKSLFTFHIMNRSVPLATRYWNLGSESITKGKYTWFVPTLKVTKDLVAPELLEFVGQLAEGGDA